MPDRRASLSNSSLPPHLRRPPDRRKWLYVLATSGNHAASASLFSPRYASCLCQSTPTFRASQIVRLVARHANAMILECARCSNQDRSINRRRDLTLQRYRAHILCICTTQDQWSSLSLWSRNGMYAHGTTGRFAILSQRLNVQIRLENFPLSGICFSHTAGMFERQSRQLRISTAPTSATKLYGLADSMDQEPIPQTAVLYVQRPAHSPISFRLRCKSVYLSSSHMRPSLPVICRSVK